MKKIILMMAVMLLPLASFCQKTTDSTFTLQLSAPSGPVSKKIYLAYQIDGRKIIDSANEVNRIYTFRGKTGRPISATLVADYDNLGVTQLMAFTKRGGVVYMLKLHLHPGKFQVKTAALLTNPQFIGSAINTDDQKLHLRLKQIEDQELQVSRELRAGTNKLAGQQLDSLAKLRRPILKAFIDQNPNSYVALLSLMAWAGAKPNPAAIESLFMRLSATVRNTPEGQDYLRYLHNLTGLQSGTMAPDFTQADTAGHPVSLAGFRGRYVLLDFWASWCGPCRADNPKIVKLYHDFKDRNFTILGISLDAADGKPDWLKAIHSDRLAWTQVSDLKRWDNQLVKLYGVGYVPQNFLIGPDGMIIAKGLNPDELRLKLEKILPAK